MVTTTRPTTSSPLLPPLEDEVIALEARIKQFRAGDLGPAEFRGLRLQQGVYGQRQPDTQMIRVKLPAGAVDADQMDAGAIIAEEHSGLVRGHISTRQNFQFHFVPLESTPAVLKLLGEVGLTTREACGNTVRNVTGCPWAGVEQGEPFDVTPHLAAYARHMIRNPICQKLPRKFKTVFIGCAEGQDHAGVAIHDLGFIGRLRTGNDGQEERGFTMVVGGGTSTMAHAAPVLYDFVPIDRYIQVAEAVLRVFDKEGGFENLLRKNRNKARIKFLVKKIGIDAFRELVEEEMKGSWVEQAIDFESLSEVTPEEPGPEPSASAHPTPANHEAWVRKNCIDQKQPGFKAVNVMIPLGNISPDQFRGLARIMRTYSGGYARTTQTQNLVLRWVHDSSLAGLHSELDELGFGGDGADYIQDVVSCPGADSCALAVTSSMGMGRALSSFMQTWEIKDDLSEKVSVKISGCPNGCGQHHIGNIGFQGAALKVDGREVPAYDVFVGGGGLNDAGRFAQRIGVRVPAKRGAEAVQRVIGVYEAKRNEGEEFLDFVERVGPTFFQSHLKDLEDVGPVHKDMETYFDWDSQVIFQVIRGEGECAA